MNTRKNWSDNFYNTNSNNINNSYYTREETVNEVQENFNIRRYNSAEGYEVECEGVKDWVLIQSHTNPLNEKREDKKMHFPLSFNVQRGNIINWVKYDENWLCVSKVDIIGDAYKSVQIDKCNNILKFYNSFSKLIQIPCIAENNLGLNDVNSTMSTGDAKLTITISNNTLTQDIKRNKRLICDGTAWHVTNISKLKTGLIELTCEEIESQDGDDLINEIPMNEYLPINILLLDSSYSVNLGSTIKLNPIIKQGDFIINLPLIFTSDNTDVITVDNLGNITTVGIGTANITCSLADNEDVKVITNVEVINEVVVDNFTYDIISSNGSYVIKKTVTSTFSGVKYNNLVVIPDTLFDFSIVNYNGLSTSAITIVAITDTYIKIKNNVDIGSIILRATERGTSNYVEKTIQLKNIYGN